MKSITILGANDKELTLITNNKIDNIIDDLFIIYNLYKNKYFNSSVLNKNDIQHVVTQLIKLFYKYDNNISYSNNVNNFISFLFHFNNFNSIIDYMFMFFDNHNILDNYYISMSKINYKLNTTFSNLTQLIFYIKSIFNHDIIKNIELHMTLIENDLQKKNIIVLKKMNLNNLHKMNIYSIDFLNLLISNLDIIILNIKSIKINILNIDSNINIITELLYKLYLLLPNNK